MISSTPCRGRRSATWPAAAALPNAQALTRAGGRRIAAKPHTRVARRTPGDVLLLCTDGVSDLLHTGAMRKILVTSANLGGRDAATAVAARYVA
jgi:serine/threonine protein phosphatase PrpC